MFELIVIVIVIALVAVLSTPKNKNQSNQSSGSYDRGYWAGRRDLRQEVISGLKMAVKQVLSILSR